jgi:hypothetical protein
VTASVGGGTFTTDTMSVSAQTVIVNARAITGGAVPATSAAAPAASSAPGTVTVGMGGPVQSQAAKAIRDKLAGNLGAQAADDRPERVRAAQEKAREAIVAGGQARASYATAGAKEAERAAVAAAEKMFGGQGSGNREVVDAINRQTDVLSQILGGAGGGSARRPLVMGGGSSRRARQLAEAAVAE